MIKNERQATICALLAVLIWSTVASAFKLSLRVLSPIELLLYASAFSTLLLGLILLIQGRFRQAMCCTKSEYLLSIALGILSPFLYYLVLFKAYDLLPAQQAQPLNYTWAITLSLLAVPFLKQKISSWQWLALFISYCGVVVISTEGQLLDMKFTSGFGVALALGSTVLWSLYWILNTRDQRDPVVGLFVNFLFGFPLVLIYWLLTSDIRIPPIEGILGAAYVGAFEMGICFVLWLLALKKTENTARIGNLIFLSPFLSLILIHLFVGEDILPSTFLGLILIVAGLICQKFGSQKK